MARRAVYAPLPRRLFPMQVKLAIDYPPDRVRLESIEPGTLRFKTVAQPGLIRLDALFEGTPRHHHPLRRRRRTETGHRLAMTPLACFIARGIISVTGRVRSTLAPRARFTPGSGRILRGPAFISYLCSFLSAADMPMHRPFDDGSPDNTGGGRCGRQ